MSMDIWVHREAVIKMRDTLCTSSQDEEVYSSTQPCTHGVSLRHPRMNPRTFSPSSFGDIEKKRKKTPLTAFVLRSVYFYRLKHRDILIIIIIIHKKTPSPRRDLYVYIDERLSETTRKGVERFYKFRACNIAGYLGIKCC